MKFPLWNPKTGRPVGRNSPPSADTVNVASRLEGATKELDYPIGASGSAVRAAGAGVRTGKAAEIRVKGGAEMIKVHEILSME